MINYAVSIKYITITATGNLTLRQELFSSFRYLYIAMTPSYLNIFTVHIFGLKAAGSLVKGKHFLQSNLKG